MIDPQNTVPIFGNASSTAPNQVLGSEPLHVVLHACQPNVLTPFTAPDPTSPIVATSSKVLMVRTGIPLQFVTGASGTGNRQFGWEQVTTQLMPSNEPAYVPVFNFHKSEMPTGAVWDVSNTKSNMVMGAVQFLDADTLSQAECNIQLRWAFEIRIPLANLNLAKFDFIATDETGFHKIGEAVDIAERPCYTQIRSMRTDHAGPTVQQAMEYSSRFCTAYRVAEEERLAIKASQSEV